MIKKKLLIFVFLILVIFNVYSKEEKHLHILYISSYNTSHPVVFRQLEGIEKVFSKYHAAIDVEFFDGNRFPNKEDADKFLDYLKYKLSKLPAYDGVIVADDPAVNLIVPNKKKLFPNIPIVFLGVNEVSKAMQFVGDYVTGVAENVSIDETISLIHKQFPDAKKVYVVVSRHMTDQINRQRFREISRHNKAFEYEEIVVTNIDNHVLKDKLKSISESDVVLYMGAFIPLPKGELSVQESLLFISKNTKAPIYSLWECTIINGVLGGVVISHREQGEIAGSMLLKMFYGKTPKVKLSSPNLVCFDAKIMRKYDLSESDLPDGAIILNTDTEVFGKYNFIILLILFIIVILLIFFVIELMSVNKKNTREKNILREQKERAEESDLMKSAFIANVSHEIRTPLNSILGFSNLIAHDDLSSEERLEYSRIIEENTINLLGIIDNVLELSYLDSGTFKFRQNKFSLIDFIDEVVEEYKDLFKKKNLTIKIENNLEGVDIIFFDKIRLKGILVHLLNNSYKFTEKGGVVVILKHHEHNTSKVKIVVRDSGIGIPESDKSRIFNRFEQIDKFVQGTGLGLSICKSVIEAGNGEIGVDSIVGLGSEFWINIPTEKSKK